MLKTETPSVRHAQLDQYADADLAGAFVDDQLQAVHAVRHATPQIAAAIAAAAAET